jgi:hypothetical protein
MELNKALDKWGKEVTYLEQLVDTRISSIASAMDAIESTVSKLNDAQPSWDTLNILQSLVMWYDIVLTIHKERVRQDNDIRAKISALMNDFNGMLKERNK